MTPIKQIEEEVREKCIAAHGADKDFVSARMVEIDHSYPIRLADVLLAMRGNEKAFVGVDINGYFLDCNDEMTEWRILEERWDCRADDFTLQTDECKRFIHSLLFV